MRAYKREQAVRAAAAAAAAPVLECDGLPANRLTLSPSRMRAPTPPCCSLSIVVQLAMAASLSSAQQLCGAGLLAHPATQRATHEVYQLLSTLAYTLPLPVSAFLSPDPVTQCATVLRWFQIALGLLAPLLWEAAWAARQFQQHQRQQRAQGLAPERGAHAALYGAVWSVTREGSGVPVGAIAWLLLAVSWDWCAFFSVPAAQRRWEGGAVAATMAAGT